MTNNTHDEPHLLVLDNDAYATLRADDGDGGIDVLPIVDAFCKGYAEAILFANAYHYVPCDEYTTVAPNTEPGVGMMLEHDYDATYAYQSPGKWWEGMGIDYTDAVDFLAANLADLATIADDDWANRPDRPIYPRSLSDWTVYEQHGYDLALTRNGHGTGFWDRDYGEIGDRLTDAATPYGEHSVLTNDGPTVETL